MLSPERDAFAVNPIDRIRPDIACRTDSSSSTIEISTLATPGKHYFPAPSPSPAIASLSGLLVDGPGTFIEAEAFQRSYQKSTVVLAPSTNALRLSGVVYPKLASGGPLTLDIFVKANSVYVVAIVLAMVATIFLRETGSARDEPNKPRRAPQT